MRSQVKGTYMKVLLECTYISRFSALLVYKTESMNSWVIHRKNTCLISYTTVETNSTEYICTQTLYCVNKGQTNRCSKYLLLFAIRPAKRKAKADIRATLPDFKRIKDYIFRIS